MRPSDARPDCACGRSILSPLLYNPGILADPVLGSGSLSLPVQPGTRKSERGREGREQSEVPSPCSGSSTQGTCQAVPCKEGQPQRHHRMPTLPQQVPRAEVVTTLPEAIVPSHQLGREVSSFASKQRLARQRLFSKACFECRCAKVSCWQEQVPQEQPAWDREKLPVRGWGAERGSSTGNRVMLPFRGEEYNLQSCPAAPALPSLRSPCLSVGEDL